MENVEKKICNLIDLKRDGIIEFLRKLGKISSVVGREFEAQKFIFNTFLEMGLKTDF